MKIINWFILKRLGVKYCSMDIKLLKELSWFIKKNWYSYNAMIHPQFEKNGMILGSFCVNTDTFSEQFSNVASYRPIFFWLDVDTILNK